MTAASQTDDRSRIVMALQQAPSILPARRRLQQTYVPLRVFPSTRVVNPRTQCTIIVLGCDDVGSAIAHALHGAGFAVVLIDDVDPPWPRRGMAFTDAWYVGKSTLDGETACFCASVHSIRVLTHRRLIAATTWSWSGVAAVLDASAVIDARMREAERRVVLRGRIAHAIGVGPGFVAGGDVDLAVDAACGGWGSGTSRGAAPPRRCEATSTRGDVAVERAVFSDRDGRFMTACAIGDPVRRGEVVGRLGVAPIVAPCAGVLRALSARGARVRPGQTIVEVDPRGDPAHCFGIGARSRRIAEEVIAALATRGVIAHPARTT